MVHMLVRPIAVSILVLLALPVPAPQAAPVPATQKVEVPPAQQGGAASAGTGQSGHLEWTLRGGFDANPRDLPQPRESPLLGLTVSGELVFARAGRTTRFTAGLQGDAYDPAITDPNGFWRAGVEHQLALARGFRSTTTFAAGREAEDGARRTGLTLRHRLEWQQGPLRLFLTTEGRMARINEANALFGGALPDDEQLNAWTVLPGALLAGETGEIGVSYSATRVVHPHEFDYLGLRRDHVRRQPNLFGALRWRGIALEGSLSPFTARWQEGEFDPVRRMLYTAKLTAPWKSEAGTLTFAASADRTVRDTTLPFAALEIVSAAEARLSWQPGEGRSLFAAYLRQRFKDYPGLDVASRTRIAGVEVSRRLNDRTALTLAAFTRSVRATGAQDTLSYGATLALTRRIAWQ